MSETVTIKADTKKGIKIIDAKSFDEKAHKKATAADLAAYQKYAASDECKRDEAATVSDRAARADAAEARVGQLEAELAALKAKKS